MVGNVFFRGFAMVIPGLGVGLAGAWMLAHYLHNQLFEFSASDPGTYAVGAVTLLLSAFLINSFM